MARSLVNELTRSEELNLERARGLGCPCSGEVPALLSHSIYPGKVRRWGLRGRRRAILSASALAVLGSVLQVTGAAMCDSQGREVDAAWALLLAGRTLSGVATGIFSAVVPLYTSEIAPSNVRGRLMALFQMAVTVGILSAYVMTAAIVLPFSHGVNRCE